MQRTGFFRAITHGCRGVTRMQRKPLTQFNLTISAEAVADAIVKANAYRLDERIRRFEDVAEKQPAMLGAALQLAREIVPMPLVDHALMVLLVLFECFESVVTDLPPIDPEVVQQAFDGNANAIRFFSSESEEEAERLTRVFLENWKEHALLAFLGTYLQANVKGVTRDTELVRHCCWVMTDAYVVAHHAHLGAKSKLKPKSGSSPRSNRRRGRG